MLNRFQNQPSTKPKVAGSKCVEAATAKSTKDAKWGRDALEHHAFKAVSSHVRRWLAKGAIPAVITIGISPMGC